MDQNNDQIVFLLGDTFHDIKAAIKANTDTIPVGVAILKKSSKEDLITSGAEHVITDFQNLPPELRRILFFS